MLDGSVGLLNDSSMSEPSFTGDVATKVADGATLLTVTVDVYVVTPPSLSRMRPPTARVPLSFVGHVVELPEPKPPNPAPQSNAYAKPAVVSAPDGSEAPVSESAIVSPSFTEAGAVKVAVGATLLTVIDNVRISLCP